MLYEPAFAVVAVWFRRRRARAFTALTLMAGLASTVFLPLAGWLLERQGWRGALVTLAAVLGAATVVPHALLLRRRPEDLGLLPDGAPRRARPGARRSAGARAPAGAGWRCGTSCASAGSPGWRPRSRLYALAATGVGVHLVPYLTEQGLDVGQAAALAGAVGATQLVGRLGFAPLEGRVPRGRLAALVLLLRPWRCWRSCSRRAPPASPPSWSSSAPAGRRHPGPGDAGGGALRPGPLRQHQRRPGAVPDPGAGGGPAGPRRRAGRAGHLPPLPVGARRRLDRSRGGRRPGRPAGVGSGSRQSRHRRRRVLLTSIDLIGTLSV